MKNQEKKEKNICQVFAKGCGFYKVFWIFMIGGVMGCVLETIWCWVALGELMSRSSNLFFPISIVWGIGCALFTLLLHGDEKTGVVRLFIKGYIGGGAFEFICSWVCEMLFHVTFWSYDHLPLSIGGRISLVFCILWGLVAVFWARIAYPGISGWVEKIPIRVGVPLTWMLLVIMVITSTLTGASLSRMAQRHEGIPPANEAEIFLDRHFTDELLQRVFPKMHFVDNKDH